MPFSTYSTLGAALKAFQIARNAQQFVEVVPFTVSDYLRAELGFMEERVNYTVSEFAICENLIYPILKEVWKHYPMFQLWSHVGIRWNDDLSGTPDYFLAPRSPLGTPVVEKPLVLVVEAKKDDFDWGWGQCLAGMVAAQKLNNWPEQTFYGITTNGRWWQFARLEGARFTQDPRVFDWIQLDHLCAAVNFMFDQCRKQLQAFAGAA
jgi:hypothetical protein